MEPQKIEASNYDFIEMKSEKTFYKEIFWQLLLW